MRIDRVAKSANARVTAHTNHRMKWRRRRLSARKTSLPPRQIDPQPKQRRIDRWEDRRRRSISSRPEKCRINRKTTGIPPSKVGHRRRQRSRSIRQKTQIQMCGEERNQGRRRRLDPWLGPRQLIPLGRRRRQMAPQGLN